MTCSKFDDYNIYYNYYIIKTLFRGLIIPQREILNEKDALEIYNKALAVAQAEVKKHDLVDAIHGKIIKLVKPILMKFDLANEEEYKQILEWANDHTISDRLRAEDDGDGEKSKKAIQYGAVQGAVKISLPAVKELQELQAERYVAFIKELMPYINCKNEKKEYEDHEGIKKNLLDKLMNKIVSLSEKGTHKVKSRSLYNVYQSFKALEFSNQDSVNQCKSIIAHEIKIDEDQTKKILAKQSFLKKQNFTSIAISETRLLIDEVDQFIKQHVPQSSPGKQI